MPKTKSILEQVEKKIGIKVPKDFNPKKFFVDREGLYIWSGFKERILATTPEVTKWGAISVSSFDLKDYATDAQIEKALPKDHIFKESDVCAVIADLIGKQTKGETGSLVNTGRANLFYTTAFVVSVDWYGGAWYVYAWDRDDDEWSAVYRVFSPAN